MPWPFIVQDSIMYSMVVLDGTLTCDTYLYLSDGKGLFCLYSLILGIDGVWPAPNYFSYVRIAHERPTGLRCYRSPASRCSQ